MAGLRDYLKDKLKGEIDELMKADGDKLITKPEKPDLSSDDIGRKSLLEDPYFDQYAQHTIFKNKRSRLSNKLLKDMSLRDWATSTIIQTRCDTMLRFSRRQVKRFDTGYKILKRDRNSDVTPAEAEEIRILEDFIYNCGMVKGTPEDDKMLLGDFLKMCLRDALTFGQVTVEKVKTRKGSLHRFRPVPAENVYHINKKASKKQIKEELQTSKYLLKPGSDNDPRSAEEINEQLLEWYKYIQVSHDNRTMNVYGDEDLIFRLFNPQNFADSNGYCYSPVELATINITNHLNVENYNAKFFTHGYAARGILHLKGTVTQSQLTAFRRQFHNTISGVQNAWRTPIIAGMDDVQWIQLSGSAREMEYISFNDHILRSLCAQFQIDPAEIGLDYLSSPTGKAPMQQANNEYKIAASKERGLQPILMFFEDMINHDIIPTIDIILSEKYEFKFMGYTDQTPLTEVNQMQAEMSVHATMNDLLKQVQKNKLDTPAADLPMNEAFWAIVEKNYTRGEIREKFFNDKGASERKELQYIPADPGFMAWQQLILTVDQQKMQNKVQEQEAHMESEQHSREGEVHDAQIDATKNQAAHSAVDAGKAAGLAQQALTIGGKKVANPINMMKSDKPTMIDEMYSEWVKDTLKKKDTKGDKGNAGLKGDKGEPGTQGELGPKGDKGDKGNR